MTDRRRKRGAIGRISASRRASVGRRTGVRIAKKAAVKKPQLKRKAPTTAKSTAKAKPVTKKKSTSKAKKPAGKLTSANAATKKRLERQVKAISKEIDRADALAKAALKAAEKRTLAMVKKLRADRATLQARLKTMASQGGNAFDEVKSGVEAAYQDLSEAIVKAIGHLK